MALVVALAINNGFRDTLQRNLLGAMAHINVQEKEPRNGIENWEALAARIRQVPHVTAAGPALYTPIFFSGPVHVAGRHFERRGHRRRSCRSAIRCAT
jgi:lipoprotein-releasing system permease protein